MTRTPLFASVLLATLGVACVGQQESAQPMSAPLSATADTPGVIPLDEVPASQAAAVSQRVAATEILVTYGRPVARGRILFGELVPYDEIWNPGADRATAIHFSRDVQIEGRPLGAGAYSLWAIPRPAEWTLIFSRAADVYHIPYPGEAEDALRVDVLPERGAHLETLGFYFPVVEGKDAILRLHWGETIVPLSIHVE